MKRKILFVTTIITLCILGVFLYYFNFVPTGIEVESRERILDASISEGRGWHIAKEVELDGYLICAAYSTNNRSTLAVFEPTQNGGYRFQHSANCYQDNVIWSNTVINNSFYDLVWFSGAESEYAEIIYTIDGKEITPLRFDTTDMDIIYNKSPAKEYSIKVRYYYENICVYEY